MTVLVTTHDLKTRERGLEWLSAFVMFGWGLMLAQPADTLATPNFQEFAVHGLTEGKLAWIFACVGAARIVALYINGRWPRTPIIRLIGCGVGVTLWGQIASAFWLTYLEYGIAGTGFIVYGALAASELISFYWAAYDGRYHRP